MVKITPTKMSEIRPVKDNRPIEQAYKTNVTQGQNLYSSPMNFEHLARFPRPRSVNEMSMKIFGR